MNAIDKIRILARIKTAVWVQQESRQKMMDGLGGVQISRIAPLRIRQRINPHVLGLHLHDLFKMRMLPVIIGGVLVDSAPGRVEKIHLGIERLPGHVLFRPSPRFAWRIDHSTLFQSRNFWPCPQAPFPAS